MNSSELTTALLCWLRFGRQMPYSATEVEIGMYRADVFGATENESIEIEVKISISDFKNDFKNKQSKHLKYQAGQDQWGTVPNRVYFAVPEKLQVQALEILINQGPHYGLIVLTEDEYWAAVPWKRLKVVRRAKRLNKNKPTASFLKSVIARMSSEIAHFHMGQTMYSETMQRFKEISAMMDNRVSK